MKSTWERFTDWLSLQPNTVVAAMGAAVGFVLGAVLL